MSKKPTHLSTEFTDVFQIIQAGRAKAFEWAVGAYLLQKVTAADWGKDIVKELVSWRCWPRRRTSKGFRPRICGA